MQHIRAGIDQTVKQSLSVDDAFKPDQHRGEPRAPDPMRRALGSARCPKLVVVMSLRWKPVVRGVFIAFFVPLLTTS